MIINKKKEGMKINRGIKNVIFIYIKIINVSKVIIELFLKIIRILKILMI